MEGRGTLEFGARGEIISEDGAADAPVQPTPDTELLDRFDLADSLPLNYAGNALPWLHQQATAPWVRRLDQTFLAAVAACMRRFVDEQNVTDMVPTACRTGRVARGPRGGQATREFAGKSG